MNELSFEKRDELKRLLLAGNSPRQIASAIGCTAITVRRYRTLWAVAANCGCGKPAGHQGWCKFRLQFSPQRSAWLTERWQKRAGVLDTVQLAVVKAKEFGHDMGPFVWAAATAASLAYATCRTCGKSIRVFGGGAQWERFEGWERLAGPAVSVQCKTEEQRAAEAVARKDKKSWREAKRSLEMLKRHLRQPNSRTRASQREGISPE